MKRTIALLAGFMCIMSFTACGDSNSSEELSENSVTEITEPQTINPNYLKTRKILSQKMRTEKYLLYIIPHRVIQKKLQNILLMKQAAIYLKSSLLMFILMTI